MTLVDDNIVIHILLHLGPMQIQLYTFLTDRHVKKI